MVRLLICVFRLVRLCWSWVSLEVRLVLILIWEVWVLVSVVREGVGVVVRLVVVVGVDVVVLEDIVVVDVVVFVVVVVVIWIVVGLVGVVGCVFLNGFVGWFIVGLLCEVIGFLSFVVLICCSLWVIRVVR